MKCFLENFSFVPGDVLDVFPVLIVKVPESMGLGARDLQVISPENEMRPCKYSARYLISTQ